MPMKPSAAGIQGLIEKAAPTLAATAGKTQRTQGFRTPDAFFRLDSRRLFRGCVRVRERPKQFFDVSSGAMQPSRALSASPRWLHLASRQSPPRWRSRPARPVSESAPLSTSSIRTSPCLLRFARSTRPWPLRLHASRLARRRKTKQGRRSQKLPLLFRSHRGRLGARACRPNEKNTLVAVTHMRNRQSRYKYN